MVASWNNHRITIFDYDRILASVGPLTSFVDTAKAKAASRPNEEKVYLFVDPLRRVVGIMLMRRK
jgi:hypothetical protein